MKSGILSPHYYQKAVGLVLSSGENLLSMEPKPARNITEKIVEKYTNICFAFVSQIFGFWFEKLHYLNSVDLADRQLVPCILDTVLQRMEILA